MTGCSKEKEYKDLSVCELYCSGYEKLKAENFQEAAKDFNELDCQHPHSKWASKAQILSAYCLFKAQKFDDAIGILETHISLNPYSPYLDYVYYLRALCYYTDISAVQRDNKNALLCLDALNAVIKRFAHNPSSNLYVEDSKFKKDFVISHLAAKEMDIGRYYIKQKEFGAALGRFLGIPTSYPESTMVPEALYRIIECQIALGLIKDSEKVYKVLCYNYPKEIWATEAKKLFSKLSPCSR